MTVEMPSPLALRRLATLPLLRVGVAVGLLLLTFALLWPTTASLMVRWTDTVSRAYTHGYLVVAIALWLIWRRRAALASVPVRFSPVAALLLIGGAFAWLVAYRASLQIVHQALLPAMAVAALATCFGWAFVRRIWLPLAYLYLAVPIWDVLLPFLQWTSVFAVRLLLVAVNIPAFFVGNAVQIPGGTFEIADGCAGLHFFNVALAISLLYGEVNDDRWRSRVKLIVLALLLAMLTNWIRIFIIVVAGHVTDMQHPLVSNEHYTFGWYMFAGTMLVFFLIARRWPVHASPPTDELPSTGVAVPLAGLVLAIAGLAIAAVWNRLDENRAAPAAAADLLPDSVAGWNAAPVSAQASPGADSWKPRFRGADGEYFSAFSRANFPVEAYAAYYSEQHQGKELVSYENSALGDSLRAESGARAVAGGPWVQQRARAPDGSSSLVWHAKRLDSRWQSRDLALQVSYGFRSLAGAPRADVIALRARCSQPDCSDARRALEAFVSDAWPVPHS